MAQEKESGFTDEVTSRLADLFEEGEDSSGPVDPEEADENPLRELKSVVLSVDWEISDETMTGLLRQIEPLKDAYKADRSIQLFLQLLASVGKYIKNNKARAHPDSIRLLSSVYENLEKSLRTNGMSEAEKKQLLMGQVKRFKDLKERIGLSRDRSAEGEENTGDDFPRGGEEKRVPGLGAGDEAASKTEEPPARQETGAMPPHEAFAFALEETKQVIKAEFRALRAELRLWREEGGDPS